MAYPKGMVLYDSMGDQMRCIFLESTSYPTVWDFWRPWYQYSDKV